MTVKQSAVLHHQAASGGDVFHWCFSKKQKLVFKISLTAGQDVFQMPQLHKAVDVTSHFMKSVLLLICISTFACTNNRYTPSATKFTQHDSILLTVGFDTSVNYNDKSCLCYKGKPLLTLGQSVKLFDKTFSFRPDPNGDYQNYFMQGITDYLSIDDFYNVKLPTGTIDGIIYFSADNKNRIFKLACNISIAVDLVNTSGMQIITYLHDKYFPCLPPDMNNRGTFELTHKHFIEKFRLYPSPDSGDIDHRFKQHWSLDYSIMPIPKNGL